MRVSRCHCPRARACVQASLASIAQGGGGAWATQGGLPGASGSWQYRTEDETIVESGPYWADNTDNINGATGVPSEDTGSVPLLDPSELSVRFTRSSGANATQGGWGVGGSGASGYECGGGGGGGFFGGGGGGAGVDGAGGGGGSSFLFLPAVWTPPAGPQLPPAPTVVQVRSTSIALSWPPVYLTAGLQAAAGYVVEMVSGADSDVCALPPSATPSSAFAVQMLFAAAAGVRGGIPGACLRHAVRARESERVHRVPVPAPCRGL